MDSSILGMLGGVIGTVLGVVGGAVGSYISIKDLHNDSERKLIIKHSVAMWLTFLLLIFVPVFFSIRKVTPNWLPMLLLIIFMTALGPIIIWANKRRLEDRRKIRDMVNHLEKQKPWNEIQYWLI